MSLIVVMVTSFHQLVDDTVCVLMAESLCNLLGLSFIGWNYGYAFLPRSGLLEHGSALDSQNHAVYQKSVTINNLYFRGHYWVSYRESIWKDQKIKPARIWCPNCKQYHDSPPPSISIRSMLFALKKLNVIDDDELKALDKSWKKYQKESKLDAYGKSS